MMFDSIFIRNNQRNLIKKEISASIIKDYTPKDLMLIYTFAAEKCSFIIKRCCAAYEF